MDDATFDVSELGQQDNVVYGAALNPHLPDETDRNPEVGRPLATLHRRGGIAASVCVNSWWLVVGCDKIDHRCLREVRAERGYVVLRINYRLASASVILDDATLSRSSQQRMPCRTHELPVDP